jgi:dipeptidyl aminopeptidase/acylaminoacyl peptidase
MHRPRTIACALATILAAAGPLAQTKVPPAPAEWGQFENLAIQARGGLSPDGRWLAYGINRSSRENELRIRNIASGAEKVVASGAQPAFAADSKWVAYAIGHTEAQEERLRAQRRPIHRKLGLLKLDGNAEPLVIDGVESFSLDPSGAFIVMRRYAPERPGAGGGAAPGGAARAAAPNPRAETPPAGVTIIVRELATGRDTTFGSVAEYAWQRVTDPAKLRGRMLAFTISTEDKTGNGVHLYDAASGSHRVLDSSASVYSGLAWRRDADDLAVLRAHTDDTRDGATQAVLAWRGVSGSQPVARALDPLKGVPAGLRTVSFRRPSWSDDGNIVFAGIAEWPEKADAGKKPEPPAEGERPSPGPPANDTPTIEIWHAKDVDVMPRQKLTARADRERNLLAAWHLDSGRLIPLARNATELVTPIRRQPLAYVSTWARYAMDRTIGRRAADISIIDLASGERTRVADRINDAYLQASPGGRYLLYFHQDHYWTVNTATRAVAQITTGAATSFADAESDATSPQKPAFGVAGWTPDDGSVLLYDKFDIWEAAADGSRITRLTSGGAEQVRHRLVRLDPEAEWIDTTKPMFVSLFGTWSKKSGYARLELPSKRVERLIFEDRAVSSLAKARAADVYLYVTQTFDDSPDAYVGGPDLRSARQATNTNPFMARYAWGRAEVVEFKSARGVPLQGSLHYPANWEAGRRYPHGRLHCTRNSRTACTRFIDAVGARLLQPGRRSPRRATSTSSPTSSSGRANRA